MSCDGQDEYCSYLPISYKNAIIRVGQSENRKKKRVEFAVRVMVNNNSKAFFKRI